MIAIIDYEAGNIKSVQNAMARLGATAVLTDDPVVIQQSEKVIFPGVGEASIAMAKLKTKGLDKLIPKLKQPVLGICLGQQLLCKHTEEGNTKGLGVFDLEVKKFPPKNKIPHIGWNKLEQTNGVIFKNIKINSDVYFLHSYYATLGKDTTAICNYIVKFSAALQKNNFYATQFHPEKSADIGSQILQNFLTL